MSLARTPGINSSTRHRLTGCSPPWGIILTTISSNWLPRPLRASPHDGIGTGQRTLLQGISRKSHPQRHPEPARPALRGRKSMFCRHRWIQARGDDRQHGRRTFPVGKTRAGGPLGRESAGRGNRARSGSQDPHQIRGLARSIGIRVPRGIGQGTPHAGAGPGRGRTR